MRRLPSSLPIALVLATAAWPAMAQADEKAPDLSFRAQAQVRYRWQPPADDPSTAADEGSADAVDAFTVRRLRLGAKWRNKAMVASTKVALDRGSVRLLNAWVRRDLPWGLRLQAGQFKRAIAMDYLINSAHQRLAERAEVPLDQAINPTLLDTVRHLKRDRLADRFGGARDIGAALLGRWWRGRIRTRVATYNGNGPRTIGNDDDTMVLEARADVAPLGWLDLEDPGIGRKPKLVVGGAVAGGRIPGAWQDRTWSLHLGARWRGVEVRGEWMQRDLDSVDDDSQRRRAGWYGQIAWRLPWLRALSLAARWARYARDREVAGTFTEAIDLGAIWRLAGDRARLSLAWQQLHLARANGPDHRTGGVLAQIQVLH